MCYYLYLDDIVSVERAHHHPNVQGAWQALPYFLGNRIRYHDAPHALWSSHVVYTSTRVVRVDTVLLAAHRQTVLLRVWCMQLRWT